MSCPSYRGSGGNACRTGAGSTGDKTYAIKRRGRKSLAYTGAITYEFNRVRGTDTDSFRYELPPKQLTSRSPRINPYDDFGVLEVEVEPGRLHPEIAQIDLDLSYNDPQSEFAAGEHFRFTLNGVAPPAPRESSARAAQAISADRIPVLTPSPRKPNLPRSRTVWPRSSPAAPAHDAPVRPFADPAAGDFPDPRTAAWGRGPTPGPRPGRD